MNPEILPAGPEDPRYTVTVTIDAAALDRTMQDTTWRRTRLGQPLMRKLQKAGFVVDDWRNTFQCASVVAREADGGRLSVTVTAPRPHLVPVGELNPEEAITVEYVGGVDDGWVEPLEMSAPIPPSLAISLHGSIYERWGYDLTHGAWLYCRLNPSRLSADDDEGAAAEEPPC